MRRLLSHFLATPNSSSFRHHGVECGVPVHVILCIIAAIFPLTDCSHPPCVFTIPGHRLPHAFIALNPGTPVEFPFYLRAIQSVASVVARTIRYKRNQRFGLPATCTSGQHNTLQMPPPGFR
jgi:hypothetical protein